MKNTTIYVCRECGREETKWTGKCPDCGSWNSFEEKSITPAKNVDRTKTVIDEDVRTLNEVPYEKTMRVSSRMDEFDRVLGGGVMRPSSVLVGGEPGIGKSTLMLQIISSLAEYGPVLYISGEESPSQVRLRAERLNLPTEKIQIFCDTRLESIEEVIERIKPAYIVVDSVQTLSSSTLESAAGSPNQIKTCCMELSVRAKKVGSAIFFIGHVTKDGIIAGPKIIEHMVDTVLYFESAENGIRLLRASKSRFGSVDELGLFEMTATGLRGVKDPSLIFLSTRENEEVPPGIVFTPVVEGSRTFIVEIQALLVEARGGYQRIYSDKVDTNRINRVEAILARHAGLDLSNQDIYVNVAGGVKLTEASIDLPLALALYSSKTNIALPSSLASFGELSLAGEVRPVTFQERRVKTLLDMSFSRIITSASSLKGKGDEVVSVKDIRSAVISAFRKKVSQDN